MIRLLLFVFSETCYVLAVLMVLILLVDFDPQVLFSAICMLAIGVFSHAARYWHGVAMFYKEEADRYSGADWIPEE